MAIVKKSVKEVNEYTSFQLGVISILDEYDYEILDLRYIEEFKQIVVTIPGSVLFITPEDISISFEISITPEVSANLTLILAEQIPTKYIHITDSFTITTDSKGEKIAVFGSDAKDVRDYNVAKQHRRQFEYNSILSSPTIKFYKC